MTQVDHDLTAVNCFDQQLGLIRNLGHHSRSCVPWPGSPPPPRADLRRAAGDASGGDSGFRRWSGASTAFRWWLVRGAAAFAAPRIPRRAVRCHGGAA
jgi:hypothetical protein